jgi:hypothetical protein
VLKNDRKKKQQSSNSPVTGESLLCVFVIGCFLEQIMRKSKPAVLKGYLSHPSQQKAPEVPVVF